MIILCGQSPVNLSVNSPFILSSPLLFFPLLIPIYIYSVLWSFMLFFKLRPLMMLASLSAIAKRRPSFYGHILPVLLCLDPASSVIKGVQLPGGHHALKNAFVACLKCTHSSAAPVFFCLWMHCWLFISFAYPCKLLFDSDLPTIILLLILIFHLILSSALYIINI